jgi:hypothetical protein
LTAADARLEKTPLGTSDQYRGVRSCRTFRRGHSELNRDIDRRYRLTAIFAELARAI